MKTKADIAVLSSVLLLLSVIVRPSAAIAAGVIAFTELAISGGNPSGATKGEYEEFEGEPASDIREIFAAAKNAPKIRSLDFCGFYTGMSYACAKQLADHYGMDEKDRWFRFNPITGEVVSMCFSPRALHLMMNTPNDYDAAETSLMGYLGISKWTIDAGGAGGIYRSPNDISVSLSKPEWTFGRYNAVSVSDDGRKKEFDKVAPRFYNNRLVLEKQGELQLLGCRTRVFDLPDGVKLLMSFGGRLKAGDQEAEIVTDKDWAEGGNALVASFELTEAQWKSITGRTVKKSRGPTYPAAIIEDGSNIEAALKDASACVDMINAISGLQKWGYQFSLMDPELSQSLSFYPALYEDDEIGRMAWLKDNSGGRPHPVAGKLPNIYGLYDIFGNMSELEVNGKYVSWGGDYADNLSDCLVNGPLDPKRKNDPLHPRMVTIRFYATKSKQGIPDRGVILPGNVLLPMTAIPGLDNRWMGMFEVTRGQWKAVMGSLPESGQEQFAKALLDPVVKQMGGEPDDRDFKPVTNVSWNDCQRFLAKLNALPAVREMGITFDLPTADEWECAARDGGGGPYGRGVTKDNLWRKAWYDDEKRPDRYNVGEKIAKNDVHDIGWGRNERSLWDMLGNAAEWTSTKSGGQIVVCGGRGDHLPTAAECEISRRVLRSPDSGDRFLGLRLIARLGGTRPRATGAEDERILAERRAREERAAAERRASNHAIVVKAPKMAEKPWDTIFWFKSATTFKAGDRWEVSMRIKADKKAEGSHAARTHTHAGLDKLISGTGIGDVPFGTEWSVYKRSGTFVNDQEGGNFITFALNYFPDANVYYFDDISFKINGREMIVNGNCEGSDWSSFWVREGRSQPGKPISAANVVSVPAAGAK